MKLLIIKPRCSVVCLNNLSSLIQTHLTANTYNNHLSYLSVCESFCQNSFVPKDTIWLFNVLTFLKRIIRLAEGTNHFCSYILYLTLKIITNYKISLSAGRQLCRQTLIYLIPKIKKKMSNYFFLI